MHGQGWLLLKRTGQTVAPWVPRLTSAGDLTKSLRYIFQIPWVSDECKAPNSPCINAGCTANDVTLAVVEVITASGGSIADECVEGSLIVKSLKFKLRCGATSRYDIGIFCKF